MINLHSLKPRPGSRKRKLIIGRGNASGHGTYSGRGLKGQKARTGGRRGLKRLGMRFLVAQTPKLGGFQSREPKINTVNVGELDKLFKEGEVVTPRLLMLKKKFPPKYRGFKILGQGNLSKKLEVRAHDFSISARKTIIEAGGKAIIIPLSKKR